MGLVDFLLFRRWPSFQFRPLNFHQAQDASFKINKAFWSNPEPEYVVQISQTRRNERSFGETNRKKYGRCHRFSYYRHIRFLYWSSKSQEGRLRRIPQDGGPRRNVRKNEIKRCFLGLRLLMNGKKNKQVKLKKKRPKKR